MLKKLYIPAFVQFVPYKLCGQSKNMSDLVTVTYHTTVKTKSVQLINIYSDKRAVTFEKSPNMFIYLDLFLPI